MSGVAKNGPESEIRLNCVTANIFSRFSFSFPPVFLFLSLRLSLYAFLALCLLSRSTLYPALMLIFLHRHDFAIDTVSRV